MSKSKNRQFQNKILWQDPVPNQSWISEYHDRIRNIAVNVVSERTLIDISSLKEGYPSPAPSYPHIFNSLHIAQGVYQAEKKGYDAVIIGCMLEGGLRESRSLVKIPVIGAFGASSWLASMLGHKFSILVTDKHVSHIAEELIEKNGLEKKVVSIKCLESKTSKLIFKDQNRYVDLVIEAMEKIIEEDGAEAIIPFCTITGSILASRKALSIKGVPIVDPVSTSIKIAESMTELWKTYEIEVCRKSIYKKPPSSFLDKIPI